MDEEAALLRAIVANPADDIPRLVYADWLDENDRHDRAAFIRMQVERAQLPGCERPMGASADSSEVKECGACRYCELHDRETELLNRRVDSGECPIGYFEWLGPATALYPNGMFVEGRVAYRRGFLESLELSWELCRDHLDAVRACHPVTSVRLAGVVTVDRDAARGLSTIRGDPRGRWFTDEEVHAEMRRVGRSNAGEGRVVASWELAVCALRWPGVTFERAA
jgi:uncharacterized protein (TIGR02996 family)